MPSFADTYGPLVGLGMASLVLATVALILFFMPVLGIPLSACGVGCGVIALVGGIFVPRMSLRWSAAGTALSAIALALNLALAFSPTEQLIPEPEAVSLWQRAQERPFVAPPSQK